MNIPGIFTIPLHAQNYLFCLLAQFLKPSSPIYIVSRGGSGGEGEVDEKINFAKRSLNRNREEKHNIAGACANS